MSEAIWVVIIPTIPATLIAIGKGFSYVIGLIQDQHTKTVDAKNLEIGMKDDIIEDRDQRIVRLENQVRRLGEDPVA